MAKEAKTFDTLYEKIRHIPKVLLHTHLEGSLPLATLINLSNRNHVQLPFLHEQRNLRELCARGGWKAFLNSFNAVTSCFVEEVDYFEAVFSYGKHLAAINIIHAEIHVSPWSHFMRGVNPDKFATGLLDGVKAVRKAFGVSLILIADIIRSPMEDVELVTRWILNLPKDQVPAVGISGGPDSLPYESLRRYTELLKSEGRHLVVHAGELEGPLAMRAALNVLQPDRIIHGVRATEDSELLSQLVANSMHLELCPTSNIVLGIDTPGLLMTRALLEAGATCSINTDDELFFQSDLIEEFRLLINKRIIAFSDIANFQRNAAHSAFVDESTRRTIVKQIQIHCNNKSDNSNQTSPP